MQILWSSQPLTQALLLAVEEGRAHSSSVDCSGVVGRGGAGARLFPRRVVEMKDDIRTD